MTIGEKIKVFRVQLGMTQADLAEKAGVSKITIQQYELNKRNPRSDILLKIANVLDVPILEFADISGSNFADIPKSELELKKELTEKAFSDIGKSLQEEHKRAELLKIIHKWLRETQYSSDELGEIIQYMLFINAKRKFPDDENALEKYMDMINKH